MNPYYADDLVTIYHGDALDVLPSVPKVDAVVTDPPFKLTQQYSASTDADNLIGVSSIWPVASAVIGLVEPGGVLATYYDTRILPLALEAFRRAGWKYLRALTLYRRWGQASKVHGWMSTSDFVLVFARPGATPRFFGEVRHDVYVKASPEVDPSGHPAQKPIDATAHLVANVTPPGGLVLDPFAGSGTTLVAAQRTGRRAVGVEIEERYCEVAAERCRRETSALSFLESSAVQSAVWDESGEAA